MQDSISLTYSKQPMFKYKKQEILAAPPERLVLHLYDHVIRCCAIKNGDGASRALAELINALNFDYGDIAAGLLRLYEYCLRRIKAGQYEEPLNIIRGLRECWDMGLSNEKEAAVLGVRA